MRSKTSRAAPAFPALVALSMLWGFGSHDGESRWSLPNGDLAGTRAASGSRIDAKSVRHLRVRWRFPLTARPSSSGIFASTPVADGDTVYVQDLRSNVYALDRATGSLR